MSRTYYCPKERLVFVSEEDTRNFFFEEQVYTSMEYEGDFEDFLSEKYSRADIFRMTNEEKAEVLADYHEVLFEQWCDEELVECDIYED